MQSEADWAFEEFGSAELGDRRRTNRLVAMAAGLALHPAGRVTKAYADAAGREGAYRLLENPCIKAPAVGAAMNRAAALRSAAYPEVIVAIDEVAFAMAHDGPGFGPICGKRGRRGAHAMTALALSPDGWPLGVLGHVFWTRPDKPTPDYHADRRPSEQRESHHWLKAITRATEALREMAPTTRPWFQVDRGGDCAEVWLHAMAQGVDLTARSCYDRVCDEGKLWPAAARAPLRGSYRLTIRTPTQRAREVTVDVRSREVNLHLRPGPSARGALQRRKLWVVEARERGRRAEKILWRLLTTKPAETFEQARAAIDAYTRRWRIEEMHLAWKSGACGIEDCWLRDKERFYKWATITLAVAVRLERIKLLSRSQPDLDATTEFSADEIDAAIILRRPKGVAIGARPTLGVVVRWIADVGGYTGKSSGGPPGIRVLSRGFDRVATAAVALVNFRALQK